MKRFFESFYWEVKRTTALVVLGALLGIIHIVYYFDWIHQSRLIPDNQFTGNLACWDFFSLCTTLEPSSFFSFLFTAYLVTAALAIVAFVSREFIGMGLIFLLLASTLHIGILVQDATLFSDFQPLFMVLNFGFLFIPNKNWLTRTAVIAAYGISSLLMFNAAWLSGLGIVDNFTMPWKALEWVGGGLAVIELALPVLLLSSLPQSRFAAIIGLAGVHICELIYRGGVDPIAKLLLLVFFVFDFFSMRQQQRESYYQSFAHPEPTHFWWPFVLGTFLFAQAPLFWSKSPLALLHMQGDHSLSSCEIVSLFANEERQHLRVDTHDHPEKNYCSRAAVRYRLNNLLNEQNQSHKAHKHVLEAHVFSGHVGNTAVREKDVFKIKERDQK